MTMSSNGTRASNPDFVPSLRVLIEQERFKLEDVGLMFGVTRERVRQWCSAHGVNNKGNGFARRSHVMRRWNDAANRFEPVAVADVQIEQAASRFAERVARREERLAARRAEIVAKLRTLKERLGREPTIAEMGEAVVGRPLGSGSCTTLVHRWMAGNRGGRTYASVMDEICDAAGIRRREPGHHGHREDCRCVHCNPLTRAARSRPRASRARPVFTAADAVVVMDAARQCAEDDPRARALRSVADRIMKMASPDTQVA